MTEIENDNIFLSDKIKNDMKHMASSDASLLILGESGVGKDIVANKIHTLSKRGSQKIVIINISAIPEDLLEKELFGAVKGAFTGAETDTVGKIQKAHNSTLVLDEIGELPLIVQSKLIKVIENGTIEPLGSNCQIKVDCRIIAITNRDIEDLVFKGLFRKDLYYRLNVLTLKIPPLRERVREIKKILNYFLKVLPTDNAKYSLTNKALNMLLQYSWPGNIRELKNSIERAIVLSDKLVISSEYLLLSSENNVNISGTTLKEVVASFKKKYILQVLEGNEWNVTKSARILGIQRTYLSKLIKEL